MSNKRCPKCGFPRESETSDDICPCCGWNVSSGYEEVEMTYKNGNSTIVIKFQSEKDVYYEYTPNTIPLYEDAWGKYYLGKCYSKRDSRFLKTVTVCLVNSVFYASSIWKHIKEKHIDFKGTAFTPIIDYISCNPNHNYLIEEHYDGVSLYDLMRGKVGGVDNQPIGFAVKMYEMYQNRKIDFAKMVVTVILKEINIIHSNDMDLRFIELPENIIFTVNGEIKIRIRGSLLSVCKLQGAIIPDELKSLWPIEYASPRENEKGESFEVYVVGILLYCILTGHLPYKGRTSLEDCHKIHEPYVDPRYDEYIENPHFGLPLRGYDDLLLDEIQDEHLKIVIKKATQLNPSKRFQSVTEFIKALEERNDVHIPWYRRIISLFHYTMNRLQCVLLSALFALSFYLYSNAQNTMRIIYKDGSVYETPIENIESITFVEKDILHYARLSAECTHSHPEGIKGAQATALCIFMARRKEPKEEIRLTIEKEFGYNLSMSCDDIRKTYTWGATCQDTVPQAICAFLDSNSFEDAIRNAISIGGDSDTLACITGSIAEPYYGIPYDIYKKGMTYLPKHLKDIVLAFECRFGNNIQKTRLSIEELFCLFHRKMKRA